MRPRHLAALALPLLACGRPGDRQAGAEAGGGAAEWWVHVTTPERRQGWFRADTTYDYRGADRCA